MAFRHKLVVRKSPLSEKENETAVIILLLALAFLAASSRHVLSYSGAIALTLILVAICTAYNVTLLIRNRRRKVPMIIDTTGRWIPAKTSPAEVKSHLDYYCEIPRSEHGKGPAPTVSILDSASQPIASGFIVRPNEFGDVTIHLHPRLLPGLSPLRP